MSTPRSPAPRAPSSWCPSTTPATPSTRPTRAGGQLLRRALRHRRHLRRGRRRGRRGYNPVRGAKVIAWGRAFLDSHAPLAERQPCRRHRLRRRRRRPPRSRWATPPPAWPIRASSSATPAIRGRPDQRAVAQARPPRRHPHRPHRQHRQGRRRRRGRHRSRVGGLVDHGLRGLGQRGRRRRQGRRLRQLARPDEGRPRRHLPEGRRDDGAPPQRRPRLHRRRRIRAGDAGPGAACSCATSGTTSRPTLSP